MLTRNDLRVGSVLKDLNGAEHTVKRFDGIFIITTSFSVCQQLFANFLELF